MTSPPGGGVTVLDAPLNSSNGTQITGIEGNSTGTQLIGSFSDANQAATVADFTSGTGSVVVNWGDGSAPQSLAASNLAAIGSPGGVTWAITASHTYADMGTYAYTVSVTDDGGSATTISGSASIGDADLTAGATMAQSGNTGTFLSGYGVGSFMDANPLAPASDFTGVVDWGDGSPNSVAQFVNVVPGAFNVYGSHIYGKPGVYDVTTNVIDGGGKTTTLTGTFTITDLPVTGSTKSFTATEGVNTGRFTLATFTDPNMLATVADVNAQLAVGGWGDGTPGTTGINLVVEPLGVDPSNGDPIFEVLGSHTYADETPQGVPDTLSVIITTLGGATTTLTSPPGGGVTVLDASLTSSNGTEIRGTSGISMGTVLLGSFNDANPMSTPADFTATIAWGGTGTGSTVGTISQPGGIGTPYLVSGSFAYAQGGTYAYTITVTDDGGQGTIISGSSLIGATDPGPSPTPTAPAVITALNFDRFDATLTVTFQNSSSGMDLASITNSAFYHISATPLLSNVSVPKTILPTSISYTPGTVPSDPVVVNVVFNHGHVFRGGVYEVIINSGTGDTGIQDAAGNALDGNFYGTFPTGDGLAGGNFVADIYTYRNVVLRYVPIADGYVPPRAATDPPAGLSSTPTTHKAATITHKTKAVTVNPTPQNITARNAKLKAFDAALRELAAASAVKTKTLNP